MRDRFSVISRHVLVGSVLEVGCVDSRPGREATGARLERKSSLLFRRIAEVNPDVLGVDIDAEGVEILRKEGHNVRCADAAEMDLGRRFDTIVAGDVIEHVENVGLFLRNLGRHLKPAGVLIVTTPNPFSSSRIHDIWRRGRPRVHENHTAWFDPITLQSALRRAGLEPFEGYWVRPRQSVFKMWRRLFRGYFSNSFMILSRLAEAS